MHQHFHYTIKNINKDQLNTTMTLKNTRERFGNN